MSRRRSNRARAADVATDAAGLGFGSPLWIWAGVVLIAIVTVAAYWPAIDGGFVLDDDQLVTDNNLVQASGGLQRIWFTSEAHDYWPVTNSSFWLEWRLWGKRTAGYHTTNLLLHIGAALLLWAVLRRLAIPGAFLAAMLFAVHPVNVESVAWIAQRKNTLAMLFFLASSWCYLRSEGDQRRWYWLSLLAFLLAMLSKGSVAILPMALLGLAWWQRGTVAVRDLARCAPFFLVAIVLTAVNIWFQRHGSEAAIREADLPQRVAGAGAVVWFYLGKALLPIDLSFVYPQWRIAAGNLLWWLPLAAAIVVTALLWRRRNSPWGRPALFGWGFFCVALAPVLGFTDVGFMRYSLVSDHYQHIAILGVVALAAAAWIAWHNRVQGAARMAALATAAVVVLVFAALTWKQSALYADAVTLYEDTLAKNPDCWLIHNNLAGAFREQGRLHEAFEHARESIRLNPNGADAHINLGNALAAEGRTAAAIEQYQQAIIVESSSAKAHYNLALLFARTNDLPQAIVHYGQAVQLDPDYAEARVNLGNALLKSQRVQEAIEQYEAALRLRPSDSAAHADLAAALASLGRFSEAIEEYQLALRYKPDSIDALANMALAYAALNRSQEAIAAAERSLALARAQEETAFANQLETWLSNYRAQHDNSSGGTGVPQSAS